MKSGRHQTHQLFHWSTVDQLVMRTEKLINLTLCSYFPYIAYQGPGRLPHSLAYAVGQFP